MSALALVILAAGESSRLGEPKALVRLRDREPSTPLAWLLDASRSCATEPALVVTGADHAPIAAACPGGIEVLENARWREGRTGSVRLAARARPGRDLLLAPVDVPLVPAEVFRALAEEWSRRGRPERGWLAPWLRVGGGARHGHPVVIGRSLLGDLEGFSRDQPLSELRGRAAPLLGIEVASPAVLDDLDRPEDLLRLRAGLSGC